MNDRTSEQATYERDSVSNCTRDAKAEGDLPRRLRSPNDKQEHQTCECGLKIAREAEHDTSNMLKHSVVDPIPNGGGGGWVSEAQKQRENAYLPK